MGAPCNKLKYTENDAKTALNKIKKERKKVFGDTPRQEKRVYLCTKCKAYHLTSISREDAEFMNRKRRDKKRVTAIKKQKEFLNSINKNKPTEPLIQLKKY